MKLDEKDNDENETDTRVILRDKDSLDPDEFPKAFAESEANSELNRKIKHISRYGTDLETEVVHISKPEPLISPSSIRPIQSLLGLNLKSSSSETQ